MYQLDKIFSVETFDRYKRDLEEAHSPFRVFTAKELELDPLINYFENEESINNSFNDEQLSYKKMQEDNFSLGEDFG